MDPAVKGLTPTDAAATLGAQSPVPTGSERRALVEAIHASGTRLVLAVAGGGNAVITDLLNVPGASRTVLEVVVPYAETSLDQLVGRHHPGAEVGACSRPMALAMAQACYDRARDLAGPGIAVVGVACTAALVTDRPKRGDHRAHVAQVGPDWAGHCLVSFDKGELDRIGEDRVVADEVLHVVAAACGVLHR